MFWSPQKLFLRIRISGYFSKAIMLTKLRIVCSTFSSKSVNNVSGIFLRVRGQRSVKSGSLVHVWEGGGGASAPADKVQAMRVTPPAPPPRLTLSLAPAWPRITSSFQLISLNCTIFITYRKRLHFVFNASRRLSWWNWINLFRHGVVWWPRSLILLARVL